MAYDKYKDLEKRTQSNKVFRDKAFEIENNPKYDGYQRGLASMVYRIFEKKSKGDDIKNEIKENQQLANELHKPIIRKFKKKKIYSSFKDNIWRVDLADMQLISKYNKGIRYLLCVVKLFSKYAFVVPLKDKKVSTIANAFQSILDNSKRKPNKIWTDQGGEFYNTHFKKWLKENNIEFSDLNREEIVGSFYEKELQKTNQKEFRIEKILKTKGNKLYVKWKGYNNSFNTWIDKKDLIK